MIVKRESRRYNPDWVEDVLVEIGETVQADARSRAPVLSGRLRGRITYATMYKMSRPDAPARFKDGMKPPEEENRVKVGSNVFYSRMIEYGVPHRSPTPFLRPAVDHNKGRIKELIKKAWKGRAFGR